MKIINNYAGLEYVTLKMSESAVTATDLAEIERKITIDIIKNRPIRGKELLFLRKQANLSCVKLSGKMSTAFDPSTISRFEKKKEDRLSIVNETFIRVFFAGYLNIEVNTVFNNLFPDQNNTMLEVAA